MSAPVRSSRTVPPLVNGDRLTRAEFERRYDAMPNLKKAELIDGVVYMGAAVRTEQHGSPHSYILGWLFHYHIATPGTVLSDNGSIRLDDDTMPQPDVQLLIERGGQARIDEDGYVEGGPELVAEVAAERANLELHIKLDAYRRNKVREYLVWRVADEEIDWFVLKGRKYVPLPPDEKGIVRSKVYPGLWLDVAALIRLDGPAVIATLQKGLADADHAAFVERLRKA